MGVESVHGTYGVQLVRKSGVLGTGRSPEILKSTLELAEEEGAEEGMLNALAEVFNWSYSDSVVENFRRKGRYLFGLINSGLRTGWDSPYDGLLYAQGTGMNDRGAYTVVIRSLWVASRLVELRDRNGQTPYQALEDLSLTNMDTIHPSRKVRNIPVTRLTRITDARAGDQTPVSYVYGHVRDVEVIEKLRLSDGLSRALIGAANQYHMRELLDEAERARFAEVQTPGE